MKDYFDFEDDNYNTTKEDLINSPITEYENLMRMDREIRNGSHPTPDQLAEILNVNRRTIFRYKKMLIERFSAPLKLSRTEPRGYYYENPDFTMSDILLNEDESFALQISVRLANMMLYNSELYKKFIKGINSLNNRATKIDQNKGRKAADRIQFAFTHDDFVPKKLLPEHELLILDALKTGKVLKFQMKNFFTDEEASEEIAAVPVYMTMYKEHWCLLVIKYEQNLEQFTLTKESFVLLNIDFISAVSEYKDSHAKLQFMKNEVSESPYRGNADCLDDNSYSDTQKLQELSMHFSISFPKIKKSYSCLLNFEQNEKHEYDLSTNEATACLMYVKED